ncbi:DUF4340 domain-containing protein [Nitrosomonas ureae]|uniref:DUF4340 domain-containing protein n=1 Tax=Nitrosomonas ureae TaxID=44577 RepID=A0A1H2G2K4_9PROT|nr:DUF4340 domain-containing protein [Nitrosomonas ureae]ALQ52140.1 hypothetical protein ATY38_13535 [Nitrosomonas ureae]SDU13856.1 protein of unknown function [Nitrosomonas ureae]
MTHHSRLNLIMLVTIGGLAIFLYLRPQPAAIQQYSISTTTADAIQSLRILNKHQEIVLKQSNNQWHLIEPVQVRADEEKIGKILEILTASSYQRLALENLERFGLDQPYLQLYVDNEYFGFGGFSPTTHQQYLATNDFAYLISPRYALALPVAAIDLINPGLLVSDEIPVRFEMERWTAEFQNDGWRMTKHYSDDGFGDEILTKWIQLWQTARAEALKLEDELDSDWIEAGVIRISLQSGKVIGFKILQNKYSLVLLRMAEGIGYQFPTKLGQRLINPRAIVLNQ